MAPHREPLRRHWLPISQALDQGVADYGVLMLTCRGGAAAELLWPARCLHPSHAPGGTCALSGCCSTPVMVSVRVLLADLAVSPCCCCVTEHPGAGRAARASCRPAMWLAGRLNVRDRRILSRGKSVGWPTAGKVLKADPLVDCNAKDPGCCKFFPDWPDSPSPSCACPSPGPCRHRA